MGTGDQNAGGLPCDGLASHPGGNSNIPSRFMLQKPELSAGLMGHLARMQTLPFTYHGKTRGSLEEREKVYRLCFHSSFVFFQTTTSVTITLWKLGN